MTARINPMDLSGKSILVTGASSGIGRDTCVLLSQLGAKVILVARNTEQLTTTVARMAPGNHVIATRDITEHETNSQWMADLAASEGPLYGFVNCAGVTLTQAIRYFDPSSFDELINVNLKSAMTLTKAFRQKRVRATPEAKIVFLSSTAGIEGYTGMSIYSASKAAILGITRSLATELAREQILVNCITPGLIGGEMKDDFEKKLGDLPIEGKHLLGVGTPRSVSHAICFLLAETGNWITGQSIVVDGGLTA